jgi:hypothetical protein
MRLTARFLHESSTGQNSQMTYTMHTILPLQSIISLKNVSHTLVWPPSLYIYAVLQKLCVCQLPMTGSKQNKEPESQQSITAGLQECLMTVINTFPCTVDCFLAILSNVYKHNTQTIRNWYKCWQRCKAIMSNSDNRLTENKLHPMNSQLQHNMHDFSMLNVATPVFSLHPAAGRVKTVGHNHFPQ